MILKDQLPLFIWSLSPSSHERTGTGKENFNIKLFKGHGLWSYQRKEQLGCLKLIR